MGAAHAMALYAGHHVGDYWVQTDHQAQHKGAPGAEGRQECLKHVLTYTATQAVFLAASAMVTGKRPSLGRAALALGISAVTHYAADRRDHGLMVKLAKRIPGKAAFLKLGVPRPLVANASTTTSGLDLKPVPLDNPSLGTGAWALDQSWHIALGVFLPTAILEAGE